jgi:NADPH-dependent curcumin reductase CurA
VARGRRGQQGHGRRRYRRSAVVEGAGLAPGDIVFGDTGWQDYAAVPPRHLTRMPKIEPMTHLLSVYGVADLTAYFGLLDLGEPKTGETVVVSAAAGSVGTIVGQGSRLSADAPVAGAAENVAPGSAAR